MMSRKAMMREQRGVAVRIIDTAVGYAPPMNGVMSDTLFLQNIPSIVTSHVLAPRAGEYIIDMCAAPGGKTTQQSAHAKPASSSSSASASSSSAMSFGGGFFRVQRDKKSDPNDDIEWFDVSTEFHQCPHCK